ncbi:unnamed protein product [Fraxinus pennsylvanica]|uniref:VQ domain-containing protein n=1 Tax=Fraxinus pennsylvanica TaxID=56036 RepID=A0AAD2DL14_9LAMI|nr:unnamed protein product [Fraxinus pennsylvanica]
MEKQPHPTPPSLATRKAISKVKPKIRIIHIFAPEIIKTDAANFRELVQRLTGKPTDSKKKPKISSNKQMEAAMTSGFDASARFVERIKGEEEEIWRGANSGGGFLNGFAEFDDGSFMQEINQFPSWQLA